MKNQYDSIANAHNKQVIANKKYGEDVELYP